MRRVTLLMLFVALAAQGQITVSDEVLIQVGENRWFVAYSIDHGSHVTLAGRFVSIED